MIVTKYSSKLALQGLGSSASTTGRTSIALFSKSLVELDVAIAAINVTYINTLGFTPLVATLAPALGVVEADCLGVITLPAYTPTIENVFAIPLSTIIADLKGLVTGTPVSFCLRCSDISMTAPYYQTFSGWANFGGSPVANMYAEFIITGTVGDETSSADLRLLGGHITKDQSYQVSDLIINY